MEENKEVEQPQQIARSRGSFVERLVIPFYRHPFDKFTWGNKTIECIATSMIWRKENGQKMFHFLKYKRHGKRCLSVRFLLWQVNVEDFSCGV